MSIKRIIGLSILGSFGIHHFDGLPVISFPVPDNLESVTASYSMRMQDNFEPHANYKADIRKSQKPLAVFVGGADELFYPDRFATVFHAETRRCASHNYSWDDALGHDHQTGRDRDGGSGCPAV